MALYNVGMARHTPSNVNEKRVAEDKIMPDPRQALATSYYKDPSSDSFANLKQSMIKAGYSAVYADNMYSKDIAWINQARNTVEMVESSERQLKKVLERPIDFNNESKFNADMIKTTLNASMFVLKTLARSKYEPESEKSDTNIQVNIVRQGKTIDVEAK